MNEIDEPIEIPGIGSEFTSAMIKLGGKKIKSATEKGAKTVKGVAKLGKFVVENVAKGAIALGNLIFKRKAPKTSSQNTNGGNSDKITVKEAKETVSGVKNFFGKIKEAGESKLYNLILYIIEIVLLVLCTAVAITSIVKFISARDLINILYGEKQFVQYGALFVCPVIIVALIIQIIAGVISLFKKEREPKFGHVTTLIVFYIYSRFADASIAEGLFQYVGITFGFYFYAAMVVAGIYAVLRLVKKDLGTRIWAIIFSALLLICIVILNKSGAGNFFSLWVESRSNLIPIEMMKIDKTVSVLITAFKGEMGKYGIYCSEALFYELVEGKEAIFLFMGMLTVFIVKCLPFLFMTMIANLAGVLMGGDLYQYERLNNVKKNAFAMLIIETALLILAILMSIFAKGNIVGVTLNIGNIIFTYIFTLVLVLFSVMPWGIAELKYKSKYLKPKKAEA